MKLNKQNKKGFTIVELVIVIAVIGILSAILIPTFANLTTQAQAAAAKQEVADAYTAYIIDAADGKVGEDEDKPLKQYAQDKVAIKRGDNYFTYSNSGWEDRGTELPTTPVDLSGATKLQYTDTYNNCEVYAVQA